MSIFSLDWTPESSLVLMRILQRAVTSASKRTTISFQELNQKKYRTPLILGIGLLVLQNLSGINGILFYASNIFKAAGVTNSDLATCSLGAIQVCSYDKWMT
jgi:SP family facilitated glucose transporter-like MFS transporter 8